MRIFNVPVQRPYYLVLGYAGESGVQQVVFDYDAWADEFGEGILNVLIKRNGDASYYPAPLSIEYHKATWTVSDVDTSVEGEGEYQLYYTVDGAIKKSSSSAFKIDHSIPTSSETPDPYKPWVDSMIEIGAQVQENAIAVAENTATVVTKAGETAENARLAGISEANAADSATLASNKANEASGYAQTASTKAGEAAQSAQSASASAQTATNEADEAERLAIAAGNHADDAYESARQAKISEENAAESAADAENRVYGVGMSLAIEGGMVTLTQEDQANEI